MSRTFERFDGRDGLVHGFVVEQTLVGYGVRELVRSPWSQVWRQVGFVDGFGSSAAARGSVDGWEVW